MHSERQILISGTPLPQENEGKQLSGFSDSVILAKEYPALHNTEYQRSAR